MPRKRKSAAPVEKEVTPEVASKTVAVSYEDCKPTLAEVKGAPRLKDMVKQNIASDLAGQKEAEDAKAKVQKSGYPRTICRGVTETKPGRFKIESRYEEARAWREARRNKA